MTPLDVVLVCAVGGGPTDAERKRADAAEAAARLGVAAAKGGSRLVVMLAEFKEFVSAFVSDITRHSLPLFRARDISLAPALRARGRCTQRTAAYRWLWIQSCTGCIGGIIQGCFSYYWFQDCYPHGYYFLGWKVSHSVQTAVSVNIIVGTFTNICVSWSGNYWREREGGAADLPGPQPHSATGNPDQAHHHTQWCDRNHRLADPVLVCLLLIMVSGGFSARHPVHDCDLLDRVPAISGRGGHQ
eukprot:COSAG01_NODE_5617_length_4143_cov_2.188180_3_plen_244_part_00